MTPDHLDRTHWSYDAHAYSEMRVREALRYWPAVLGAGALVVACIALFMAATP